MFKALGNHVIVSVNDPSKTASGIEVVGKSATDVQPVGEVVSIGDGVTIALKLGDIVRFNPGYVIAQSENDTDQSKVLVVLMQEGLLWKNVPATMGELNLKKFVD